MTIDWKWLDSFLKASGPKTAAIALACGLFLLIARWQWIPALDPWMIQAAALVFLLTLALTFASIVTVLNSLFRPREWFLHAFNVRRDKRMMRDYIPYMNEQEREIIGYLLARNQKTFEADADGGRAASLLSHGIVRIPGKPGQHFDAQNVPMRIPDHIWDVLVEHKETFPRASRKVDGDEPYPWRRNWMERI